MRAPEKFSTSQLLEFVAVKIAKRPKRQLHLADLGWLADELMAALSEAVAQISLDQA